MFEDRLKKLREEKHLNMKQAANQLGIKYTTYVSYEKNEREANSDVLIALANFYDCSTDYLVGKDVHRKNTYRQPQITDDVVTFPVIGEIAAGYDNYALEDWTGETVVIPRTYLKGRNREDFFVLSVKGDSMYPQYQSEDKVLVLKQNTVERSGDVAAVLYEGEKATLKKVEFMPGESWLKLVPINPEYKPKTISGVDLEECRIIGIPTLLVREIEK